MERVDGGVRVALLGADSPSGDCCFLGGGVGVCTRTREEEAAAVSAKLLTATAEVLPVAAAEALPARNGDLLRGGRGPPLLLLGRVERGIVREVSRREDVGGDALGRECCGVSKAGMSAVLDESQSFATSAVSGENIEVLVEE